MEMLKDYVFEIIAVLFTLLAGGTTFGFVKNLYGKITAHISDFKKSVEINKFKEDAQAIITQAKLNNDRFNEMNRKLNSISDLMTASDVCENLKTVVDKLDSFKIEIQACVEHNRKLASRIAELEKKYGRDQKVEEKADNN